MADTVFVSYSHKDVKLAFAMCKAMEGRGIACWIAPRDIAPGKSYAGQITKAIKECLLMVLVYSDFANQSEDVDREIELCSKYKKPILPFKIDNTPYNDEKEYYLSKMQWIDAYPNPESHFSELTAHIAKSLSIPIQTKAPEKTEEVIIKKNEAPKIKNKTSDNKSSDTCNYLVQNFGIETAGDILTVLAKKGTKLPFEHKQTFSTSADNQPVVEVHLMSGNSEKASECKSLGTSKLEGISHAKMGIPQIEITFTIREDGKVFVTIKEIGTGNIKFSKLEFIDIVEKPNEQKSLIITCPSCSSKLRGQQVPTGKPVKIKCPKCSHRFKVENSPFFGLFTSDI